MLPSCSAVLKFRPKTLEIIVSELILSLKVCRTPSFAARFLYWRLTFLFVCMHTFGSVRNNGISLLTLVKNRGVHFYITFTYCSIVISRHPHRHINFSARFLSPGNEIKKAEVNSPR